MLMESFHGLWHCSTAACTAVVCRPSQGGGGRAVARSNQRPSHGKKQASPVAPGSTTGQDGVGRQSAGSQSNTVLGDPLITASNQGELLTRFDYMPKEVFQSEGDFHRYAGYRWPESSQGLGELRRLSSAGCVGHLLVLRGGHRLDLWWDR